VLPAVVKSSIRISALIRRDTVSDVARGPIRDKLHLAGMAAFGPKPPIKDGQSISALPTKFRRLLVLLLRARRRPRFLTSSRNRPARFGGPVNQANEQLEALVQGGFEPEAVARRVVAAVRDDDLYIFTHADPAYRAAVEERFGKILAAFDKAVNAQ
jgi:hypothetical protein